jgi:hypothetical protein
MRIERNGAVYLMARDINGLWVLYRDGIAVDRDHYRNDLAERIRTGKYD